MFRCILTCRVCCALRPGATVAKLEARSVARAMGGGSLVSTDNSGSGPTGSSGGGSGSGAGSGGVMSSGGSGSGSTLRSDIYDHEHLFWFGDLNYRINIENHATIFQHIEHHRWDELLKYDQLSVARRDGKVFGGFVEAPINFAPTYKYRVGSAQYSFAPPKGSGEGDKKLAAALSELNEEIGHESGKEPSPVKPSAVPLPSVSAKAQKKQDKKRRAPAWCDRILYFGRSRLDVNNLHDALDQLESVRVSGSLSGRGREHLAHAYIIQHLRMLTHLSMSYYTLPAPRVVQLSYGRHELHDSDHKPVSAVYRLLVSCVDTSDQRTYYDAIISKLDTWTARVIPPHLNAISERFTGVERAKIKQQLMEELDRSAKGSDIVMEGMGAMGVGMVGLSTAFTSGLSKSLAQLTMNDDYIREHANDSDKRRGVLRGIRAFGMGVIHGVSGIVVDPYRGAKQEGVKGFFKGVGKGLIGAVVKPMSGALDLGTNAIHGLHDAGSATVDAVSNRLNKSSKSGGSKSGGSGPADSHGSGRGASGESPSHSGSRPPIVSLNSLAATTATGYMNAAVSGSGDSPQSQGRERSGASTGSGSAGGSESAGRELMSEVVRLTVTEFVRLDTRERTRLCWNLHLLYLHRVSIPLHCICIPQPLFLIHSPAPNDDAGTR